MENMIVMLCPSWQPFLVKYILPDGKEFHIKPDGRVEVPKIYAQFFFSKGFTEEKKGK